MDVVISAPAFMSRVPETQRQRRAQGHHLLLPASRAPEEEDDRRIEAERYRMVLSDGPQDIEAMYVLPTRSDLLRHEGTESSGHNLSLSVTATLGGRRVRRQRSDRPELGVRRRA